MFTTARLLTLSLTLIAASTLASAQTSQNPFSRTPPQATELQSRPAGPGERAVAARLGAAGAPVKVRQVRRRPKQTAQRAAGQVGEGFQAQVGQDRIERLDFQSPVEAYVYGLNSADGELVEVRGSSVLVISGPSTRDPNKLRALRASIWGPDDTRQPQALGLTLPSGETVIVANGYDAELAAALERAQRSARESGQAERLSPELEQVRLADGSVATIGLDPDTLTYVTSFAPPHTEGRIQRILAEFTAEVEPRIPAERLAPGETDRPLSAATETLALRDAATRPEGVGGAGRLGQVSERIGQ